MNILKNNLTNNIMAQTISAALYNTVSKKAGIKNIYFTKSGDYYFNAFTVNELQKDGSTKPALYARTTELKKAVPGQTLGTVTVVGVPETAITETIARTALLAMKPEPAVEAATK